MRRSEKKRAKLAKQERENRWHQAWVEDYIERVKARNDISPDSMGS